MNEAIYKNGLNILGSWLQTNTKIGYSVLDVDKMNDEDQILTKLESIEGTIRTKIL